MRLRHILIVGLCTLAAPVGAQQNDSTIITMDRLFTSYFAPRGFGPARWTEDGAAYATLEDNATNSDLQDLVRYDTRTGTRQIVIDATKLVPSGATSPITIEDYAWSPDRSHILIFANSEKVWRQNTRGDYFLFDIASGSLRKLGGASAKPSTLMFATFSPDGQRVAYVRENNLYVESVADGKITPLTSDGSRTIINGTFDWVYEEELDLRNGFRWSPDGQRIAYWQLDASGVRDFNLIDNTDSLYSRVIPVQYPKAGTTNSAGRVGVVDATGGTTRWINIAGDPRNNYIARMEWTPAGELLIQQLNRPQNTNNVLLANAGTGDVRTVIVERDSAWLDVVSMDDVKWMDTNRRFTWISERDGWRHIYSVSRDGKEVKLLTPGAFDVISVRSLDTKAGMVYFYASPENATQQFLYRMKLDGRSKPERVTPDARGTHTYNISPNGAFAFHRSTTADTPPVYELVSLPDHKVVRTLEDNATLRGHVAALRHPPTEFFKVDIGMGQTLDGWMLKPPGFDPSRKYPVLFFVYGEPASQTVVDDWDSFQYLWHVMLAQRGYIVVSVDNRGTPAPRGRAFRKAIYKKVGVVNSADQAAAARAISAWPFVDSNRIGVWGWSGGGSMTLNLMFRYPELYKLGMSVAPVADEHFYDTIYQERYMGIPQENEQAYREGSPITFADRLQGKLLVVHGSGDDNVHFQNTEALINRLVETGKQFSMMEYPNRTHCICEGKGTYKHLYTLLANYLSENLRPGPLPIP